MIPPPGFVTCADCPPGELCAWCAVRAGQYLALLAERYPPPVAPSQPSPPYRRTAHACDWAAAARARGLR